MAMQQFTILLADEAFRSSPAATGAMLVLLLDTTRAVQSWNLASNGVSSSATIAVVTNSNTSVSAEVA